MALDKSSELYFSAWGGQAAKKSWNFLGVHVMGKEDDKQAGGSGEQEGGHGNIDASDGSKKKVQGGRVGTLRLVRQS